jgi:hypothetical protein
MKRAALALFLAAGARAQEEGAFSFEKRVLPILSERCYSCHSAKAERVKGGLLLDSPEGILKGGDQGRSVVPGDLEKSLLIRAVRWTDEDLRMPPKKKLADSEIAALEAWVKMGAPDPRRKAEAKAWEPKTEDVWAFQPLRREAPPFPEMHPVDAFLRRKLEAKGLAAAPPADRATLLRRAAIDLTGLPAAPEDVEAFVKDGTAGAFERVVDRLLASARYGEQWARHWLDVARYADTSGFSNDFERPSAWRYRDYVIRSLNADKPFDRFILEQVAGDELDPSDPECLIAAGFLRMGPWEHTSMSVAAVTRQHFLDDVTHSVGTAFLGLTMRCARCHDHKFDPLPTRDYYRLQAVFAPVQFADRDLPFQPYENTSGFAEGKARNERLLREKGYREAGPTPDDPKVKKSLEKVGKKRHEHFEREAKRYEPLAFSVYDGPLNGFSSNRPVNRMPAGRSGPVQEVNVLKGGALESPGERVAPGVPGALKPAAEIPEGAEGRRLALARWIAASPLAARVIVNRVWQHHFGGKGLVATPNNFGKMGKRPTHPELLDWLAGWFVENGGSLKKLHRLLMTSEAYRRAGHPPDLEKVRAADPANDLLSYYPPRRLAAEEIRDGMLAVSGELALEMGGPGIFPEINLEVAFQPRHVMGGPAPAYQPSPRPEQRNRRTIYAYRTRTLSDPMLEAFNQPGSEISCERRDETTVAPQAFALFHGQFSHDRALAFARRLEKASGDPAARLDLAFQWAYGRVPSEAERKRCLDHVAAMEEYHRRHAPARTELPTSVRREMVEEFTGEVEAWEEELDQMKVYVRDLKPWDVGPETRALAELCLVLFNSNEFLYVR